MITTTALSASLFLIPPPVTPVNSEAQSQVCLAGPAEPSDVQISYFDDSHAGAVPAFSAVAVYQLSSGDIGEAYISADGSGNGEVYFAINGDITSMATSTVSDEDENSTTSTWVQPSASYPPELIAELVHHNIIGEMAIGMIPQEFKCSRFGKKVMKVAKYAVYGAATAVTAACCTAVTPGCLVCAFSAGAGAGAGAAGDAFDGYCE